MRAYARTRGEAISTGGGPQKTRSLLDGRSTSRRERKMANRKRRADQPSTLLVRGLLDEFLGDAAHADETGRFAVHVETEEAFELEITFARAVDGAIDLAVEREHERHSILGHGVGRIGRHAHHVDAVFDEEKSFHEYPKSRQNTPAHLYIIK